MAKSFRLDAELEEQLARVAEIEGQPVSVVIRTAIQRHCAEVLRSNLRSELGDIIGSISVGGGHAKDTGASFKAALQKRHKR